jgi:hypothetical protein
VVLPASSLSLVVSDIEKENQHTNDSGTTGFGSVLPKQWYHDFFLPPLEGMEK